MAHIVEPPLEQILAFCAEDPVERVFLEDVARRGLGRFSGLEEDGRLVALCHSGANVVPSGAGCGAFAGVAVRARARMLIGEQARRLRALGGGAAAAARGARGPARPARLRDLGRARAGRDGPAAGDALRSRPARPRLRARARGRARDRPAPARRGRLPLADARADRGGPLVALGGGRRHPLQGRGVGVDAAGRAAAAGLDRSRGARRRQRRPRAARPDPAAARAGADASASSCAPTTRRRSGSTTRVGMSHVLDYRSVLL